MGLDGRILSFSQMEHLHFEQCKFLLNYSDNILMSFRSRFREKLIAMPTSLIANHSLFHFDGRKNWSFQIVRGNFGE